MQTIIKLPRTSYWIVTDLVGGTIANGTLSESFDSFDDAVTHWEAECRDRKKGDGYDQYWNAKPCIILEKVLTERIFMPDPKVTEISDEEVYGIIDNLDL